MNATKIHPTEINVHTQSRTLEIAFEDGERFTMTAEHRLQQIGLFGLSG